MSHELLDVFTVTIYIVWTISCVALLASVATVLRRIRRTGARVALFRSTTPARTATERALQDAQIKRSRSFQN